MTETTLAPDVVLRTVTEIVAAELGTDPADLPPDSDLRAAEGVDSVKVLRIIARIERAYDVELEDEDIFAVSTTRGIADLVLRAATREPA